MLAQTLAVTATLLSFSPQGNRIELKVDQGAAEILWMTSSSFRFRRSLDGPLPRPVAPGEKAVEVRIEETPSALQFHTRYIDVTIQKRGLLISVRREGKPVMTDLSEPQLREGEITWDRSAPVGTRLYGLGARSDAGFDLRGKTVAGSPPFLLSTDGYGEYHATPGAYSFDFTAPDRYRIRGPAVDYFFYFGPNPKEIFDEHKAAQTGYASLPADAVGGPSWATLRDSLLRLTHASMSGVKMPSFDASRYVGAPEELALRARQLGSVAPAVTPGPAGLPEFRKRLTNYFAVYDAEMHERGFPVLHPLPFQFPDDPECARHADQFMLGDEMLVAPIYEPGGKRTVYLPRGIWTNLETNEEIPGRRTVTVTSQGLPVFARNGTIVPFDGAGGSMTLHYFPKLGAEFFLLESDPPDWSQAHASPAADIMRLEIESKNARSYEWVVHHVAKPVSVGFEERKYKQVTEQRELADGAWYYDAAARNFHVRVRVAAGEDNIINLNFECKRQRNHRVDRAAIGSGPPKLRV